MTRVGIIGIGHGVFGRRSDATVQELAFEAFSAAMKDAGIDREYLDASVIGSVPEYHKQRSLPGVVQEYLGLNPTPTWLTEVACASGSAAIRTAWMSIKAGVHNIVAVIGCQKMTELTTPEILALMGRVGEVQWESVFGTTFPAYYAMFAQRHIHEFGTTREQLLEVAVKNHYYGARNHCALFQKEITMEKALASEEVATPLQVYDCCANADGAACVILASEERAKEISKKTVWLDGMGCATASMSVLRRPNLVGLPSAVKASSDAYKMAGVGPEDIKVAQVHDCFTIAEIMAYEDLKFCKKGEGGKLIADRQTYVEGKIPVNVDGGLKAKGHPIGATGVSQTYEIAKQLRGEAGERQVANADIGLTHNVGGIGQYCFVQVLRRD
ncbi:MAG: thiolase domain-containing protein [Candidatus Aminicenantes bacterium]|nr:thiolase domain-containing protein [Candidatus Aminicenantes bacterium]NIM84844.1 thiolase domain-containing protein [Candidatus Aminicenantes bacterium]NIN24352.1 thiolase domain-containing protein [Candidatus Aminicenantes bacterium]NIN48116.1 thiolase domain-containing protein [Candidatus Aminicenantes bacterium]NIN91014.1 thiolase domain-containing protein [Candidatus Aminicenantes bacterium]